MNLRLRCGYCGHTWERWFSATGPCPACGEKDRVNKYRPDVYGYVEARPERDESGDTNVD